MQLGDAGLLPDGNIGPLIAVIVLGMCLGFLPCNIHPARIFMGDGGALLLGLLMAASTMVVGGRTDQPLQRAVVLLLRPAAHPAGDPRRADLRHAVRHRAPGPQPHGRRHGRQGPPPPPAHAARPRPPAQRVHPVGVDRAAVGVRAVPDLHAARATASCRSASLALGCCCSTRCCTRGAARPSRRAATVGDDGGEPPSEPTGRRPRDAATVRRRRARLRPRRIARPRTVEFARRASNLQPPGARLV